MRKMLTPEAQAALDAAKPRPKPQFQTAWERADYEREQRRERPLGPMISGGPVELEARLAALEARVAKLEQRS